MHELLDHLSEYVIPVRLIDLFAGIGGLRMEFENEGARCVFAYEWDSYAQKTYEANYRRKPDGNITQIDVDSISGHDILTAECPC